MSVLIKKYRGWEISFDYNKESFECYSNQYDESETKKSFSSVKKWIDDFLKDNQTFKPFFIELKPKSHSYNQAKIKIIGIRKDNRFIYEDEKGVKCQLSDYKEKDYVIYDYENEKYKEQAMIIDEEIEVLRLKRNEVLNKITGVELVDYKKELLASFSNG